MMLLRLSSAAFLLAGAACGAAPAARPAESKESVLRSLEARLLAASPFEAELELGGFTKWEYLGRRPGTLLVHVDVRAKRARVGFRERPGSQEPVFWVAGYDGDSLCTWISPTEGVLIEAAPILDSAFDALHEMVVQSDRLEGRPPTYASPEEMRKDGLSRLVLGTDRAGLLEVSFGIVFGPDRWAASWLQDLARDENARVVRQDREVRFELPSRGAAGSLDAETGFLRSVQVKTSDGQEASLKLLRFTAQSPWTPLPLPEKIQKVTLSPAEVQGLYRNLFSELYGTVALLGRDWARVVQEGKEPALSAFLTRWAAILMDTAARAVEREWVGRYLRLQLDRVGFAPVAQNLPEAIRVYQEMAREAGTALEANLRREAEAIKADFLRRLQEGAPAGGPAREQMAKVISERVTAEAIEGERRKIARPPLEKVFEEELRRAGEDPALRAPRRLATDREGWTLVVERKDGRVTALLVTSPAVKVTEKPDGVELAKEGGTTMTVGGNTGMLMMVGKRRMSSLSIPDGWQRDLVREYQDHRKAHPEATIREWLADALQARPAAPLKEFVQGE